MAKHLFNYCEIDWYENFLQEHNKTLVDYIKATGVDGIEQYVYKTSLGNTKYAEQTIGVHLNYWPYWMDFWLKKTKSIKQHFPTVKARTEYYGQAMNSDEWLSVIRKNICAALENKPDYLVWHVAEANNEEIFTFNFNYSDREVLTAAREVFNAVADEIPENTLVLFENLWWPGLRLTDPRNVKYFFDGIKHQNVGIMLDTGHLMNTNARLNDEHEGIEYICRVLEKLGPMAELVKGVHLNCSLSGVYQKGLTKIAPKGCDHEKIWQHIAKLDQHKAFSNSEIKNIFNFINPEYIVHELYYTDLNDMQEKVSQQLKLLK